VRAPVRPGHGQRHVEAAGRRVLCCSPSTRAAQDEREGIPLLTAERGRFIDQLGDVGIQAGLMVIFGVTVVVGALVLLAARGRGRAGPGWSRTGGLEARPVPHPRSPLSRRCWSPDMI
jgi:hypothetical protein